jgi:hypothetical protein
VWAPFGREFGSLPAILDSESRIGVGPALLLFVRVYFVFPSDVHYIDLIFMQEMMAPDSSRYSTITFVAHVLLCVAFLTILPHQFSQHAFGNGFRLFVCVGKPI